ncbi:hypothetical protein FPV67DRAFT_1527200 [Lyophyllum atratum]|nr:hypothetical protein FPV67DRAFT_1527200 [Lyophyllum atratum]
MASEAPSPSPSWATVFHEPPAVKTPYGPDEALNDLPGVRYALDLFLASKMVESEEYCHASDANQERLYFVTMDGVIRSVKALMSYANEDLLSAIEHAKHGVHLASQYRKKAGLIGSIFTSSSGFIKSVTVLERHAELLYAENMFEKVLLGIVYSGDWLAFIKEVLNMRTAVGIYRQLGTFIDDVDTAYTASVNSVPSSVPSVATFYSTTMNLPAIPTTSSSNSASSSISTLTSTSTSASSSSSAPPSIRKLEDPSVDAHFRSGVYLGNGLCNVVLSLIPGKLATIVELFGYKGDRTLGLDLLMRAGGWNEEGSEPGVGTVDEGVRRVLSDMALLVFHLVLSNFTVEGVDISVAKKIVEWNIKRYPNGVFFLFGAGRLALQRSQPQQAVAYYTQAMRAQTQYRNLHHISFYEIATARLALWEVGEEVNVCKEEATDAHEPIGGSAACWRVLEKEATWSKAIYSYGLAVCLLEGWDTDDDSPISKKKKAERMEEAAQLLARVPRLRQTIAGKSIPLEKFVARKARKFALQKRRLLLPALEAAYLFQAIAHAPRAVIAGKMLPLVRAALARLAVHGDGQDASVTPTSTVSPTTPVSLGSTPSEKSGKRAKKDANGRTGANAYEGGAGEYWDDLCLARFLEGVCLRFIAYPDPDAVLDEVDQIVGIPARDAEEGAEEAFRTVFEYGPMVELDHYLVYYAHYELGRLLACRGDLVGARAELELVISGKPLEVGVSGRKGKYSMENALHMRAHAALGALRNSHP